MSDRGLRVGRVLRTSTRGFTIGCAVMGPNVPAFGSFVRTARLYHGGVTYGLVYDVSMDDDPFARQFISAEAPDEVIIDNRDNRQIPIEVSVLAIGDCRDGIFHHCLPPQPPIALDWLYLCTEAEIRAFTARFDYFRLVLAAPEVPVDELLSASLRVAALARGSAEREQFQVDAGRELVRLLANEPLRLEGVLRQLRDM